MATERIIASVEARMTSSRLPGKVLLPANGNPMLYHLIRRLKQVPSLNGIVLATTTNSTDDVLVDFAKQNDIDVFRGSEDDVMTRVIGAGEHARADIIVEITGDCPIIDPHIVEQTIRMFLNNSCDYTSNAHIKSYPVGMDTQVFRLATLKKSAAMTNDRLDHEHVTLHIRNHPEIFRPVYLLAPDNLHWPQLGLTLDEPADYQLLKKVIEYFGEGNPCFSCGEVLACLKQNPDWLKINQHVGRKGDT